MPKDALGHGSNPRGGPAAHQTGILKHTSPVFMNPKALDTIRKNPGGFSVNPRGKSPSDGYMVSLPGRTKIVSESDLAGDQGASIIQRYADENQDALRGPGAHIGGWTDKESGKTYLDISQKVGSKEHAVKLGAARNQIAIWDVKRSREIRTGGTGE
jgi:hypothetical protein